MSATRIPAGPGLRTAAAPHDDVRTLVVGASDVGRRLDQFLTRRLPEFSRARLQQLIRDGHVTVTPGAAKPGLVVRAGLVATVVIPPPVPIAPQPEALPLAILYEDEAMVAIDKAAGMVMHPAAGHATGTLVNALLHHIGGLSGIGGATRPGIVHRLDKGTSGVLLVAKTDAAHRALARQFHDRLVTKHYVALVWGSLMAGRRFDAPIGRSRRHRNKMSSRAAHARTAATSVIGAEALRGVTLVTVAIGTGRTHQIRVHLSEAGHPVVGDDTYGGVRRVLPPHLRVLGTLDRPFLHAAHIGVAHPTDGRQLAIDAPLAPDLDRVLAALRHSRTRTIPHD